MLRVGLVGLDMSHAVAFTEMLNGGQVPGARVTAAWAGGSPDVPLCWSRVEQYTRTVREQWQVPIMNTPAEVAETADVVLLTATDGRVHRALVEQLAPQRKPIFVGKPIALSLADTEAIFDVADTHGTVLMSSSALRFHEMMTRVQAGSQPALGCDVFGPGYREPTQPGFFWYGIHCVEMAVAVMGVGCVEANVMSSDGSDLISLRWGDGRMASIRQTRGGSATFGITVHRAAGPAYADTTQSQTPTALNLLRAIVTELGQDRSPVPKEQTLEIVQIIEAANRSLADGRPVRISR
ncbi:MAG: oxidoreductase [Phycisphaerales bacterium]|nr:oxidoreductase [Phycisphaerales bacterium]